MKMVMRILILSVSLFLTVISSYGQELVSTSSGDCANTTYQLSWSIGEPISETFAQSNKIVTQGFQQSKLIITSIKTVSGFNYSVGVFPNPTVDVINLKIDKGDFSKIKCVIYNLNGDLVINQSFNSTGLQVNLEKFPSATYIMRIFENNNEIQTFKIVKK
jgi:hypothetical protein